MEFINYNSLTDLYDYKSSLDELEHENVTLKHGNIEKLIDCEFASEMEATKMEDVINSLATEMNDISIVHNKKYNNYSVS
jgi:hypothetical protein